MFVVLFSGISNSLSICLVPLLSQRDIRSVKLHLQEDLYLT